MTLQRVKNYIRDKKKYVQNDVVSGASGSFVLRVTASASSLIISIFLARVLGGEQYGIYAYCLSWVSILRLPTLFGLNGICVREIPKYKAHKNQKLINGICEWSIRTVLVIGILVLLAFSFIILSGWIAVENSNGYLLILGAISVPIVATTRLRQGQIRAYNESVKSRIPLSIVKPFVLIIVLGSVYTFYSLTIKTALISYLVSVSVAMVFAEIIFKTVHSNEKDEKSEYRTVKWFKSAVPFLLYDTGTVLDQKTGVVMAGLLIGPKAAGLISVARKVAAPIDYVLGSANIPLGPKISKYYNSERMKEVNTLVTNTARGILGISSIIFTLLFYFGETFLSVFGGDFTAALSVLYILCMGRLMNSAFGPISVTLNMTDNEIYSVAGLIFGGIVNLLGCMLLYDKLGVDGIAISTMIGIISGNMLMIYYGATKLNVNTTVI